MKFIKVLLAVLILAFSFNVMAAQAKAVKVLTDDESVEFTYAK